MIFSDSRYATGRLFKAWDARKSQYNLTVTRTFPSYTTAFFFYEWVEGDRLDIIANKFLGNSNRWWEIMDLNPEHVDPYSIEIGTQIRIPNA